MIYFNQPLGQKEIIQHEEHFAFKFLVTTGISMLTSHRFTTLDITPLLC